MADQKRTRCCGCFGGTVTTPWGSVPLRTIAISVVLLDQLFDLVEVEGEAARQEACSELGRGGGGG